MTENRAYLPDAMWNGARVVRWIPLRRVLNFWRLRAHVEEGLRVEFYRTRRGVTILSVAAVLDVSR